MAHRRCNTLSPFYRPLFSAALTCVLICEREFFADHHHRLLHRFGHFKHALIFPALPSHPIIVSDFQALFRGKIEVFSKLKLRKCSVRGLPAVNAFQNSSDLWR